MRKNGRTNKMGNEKGKNSRKGKQKNDGGKKTKQWTILRAEKRMSTKVAQKQSKIGNVEKIGKKIKMTKKMLLNC